MHFPTQSLVRTSILNATRTIRTLPTNDLCGQVVANASMTATLDWLSDRLEQGEPTRVAFLNAHCANLTATDAQYCAALRHADIVLPDGSGVSLAARLLRTPLVANLNGTDLVPLLCGRLAATGRSVFLLGGQTNVAAAAAASLVRDCPGLRIAGVHHGFFSPHDEDRLISEINASGADVLLVAFGVPAQDLWLQRVAPRLHVTLSLGVGGLFDFLSGRIPRAPTPLRRLGLEWTYRLYQEPKRMWRRYIVGNTTFVARAVADALPSPGHVLRSVDLVLKRGLDIVGASIGLVALAPLFLAAAAAIRATSPGPAFLRQTRVGQDGETFELYKFRSMYVDAAARRVELERQNQHGADGITFKLRRDPRVTKVGRLLRRSSIDEMPQLWNVLTGKMSLVGPRPQLPTEVARYLPHQRRRLRSKPGLTCFWQISGRADLPFEKQVALDIEYLMHRNIFLDLLILLRTIPAVLTARGAY
jgi:exopolysaccharide biosynthesis WecB/TagA/CpsF family protein